MQKVAILGMGFMGGSLGRALKASPESVEVSAYARRPETRELALSQRACDSAFDSPSDAVEGADLVVICVPVQTIPSLVESCRSALKDGAIVTDVGSTKMAVAEKVESLLVGMNVTYVGSHPIAGSEKEGLESSRSDLYRGVATIVTAGEAASSESVEAVTSLWESLGSLTYVMPPEEHDRLMARTSHLPHVLAAVLARTVGRENTEERVGAFCGTGFRDSTRIADGSPAMWRDIVETNTEALLVELEAAVTQLNEFAIALREGDMESIETYLTEARATRRKLLGQCENAEMGQDA